MQFLPAQWPAAQTLTVIPQVLTRFFLGSRSLGRLVGLLLVLVLYPRQQAEVVARRLAVFAAHRWGLRAARHVGLELVLHQLLCLQALRLLHRRRPRALGDALPVEVA